MGIAKIAVTTAPVIDPVMRRSPILPLSRGEEWDPAEKNSRME